MKYIVSILLILVTLNADEMQRIESILNDIVELRSDYEDCKVRLEDTELSLKSKSSNGLVDSVNLCVQKDGDIQKYKKLYTDEKSKNSILNTKINIYSGMSKDKKDIKIQKYKKLLKIKQYEFIQLKNQIKSMKITKKKKVCKLINLESSDNIFPKLLMKKRYSKQHKQSTHKKILTSNKKIKETLVNFKAATFRLDYQSVIYDNVNGTKLYVWEEGKTFTSNVKTISWIKVTGYFKDRKWLPAKRDMWIKISQVSKK